MEYNGIERSFDCDLLNYYLNHENVRPNLEYDYYIDASPLLLLESTYFFNCDNHGGLLFFKNNSNIYESDIYFPFSRKTRAREYALDGIEYMFNVVGVDKIEARVPDFNRRSKLFTSSLGFNREMIEKSVFNKNGKKYDTIVYGIYKWDQ